MPGYYAEESNIRFTAIYTKVGEISYAAIFQDQYGRIKVSYKTSACGKEHAEKRSMYRLLQSFKYDCPDTDKW
jgi:hypothetical protein